MGFHLCHVLTFILCPWRFYNAFKAAYLNSISSALTPTTTLWRPGGSSVQGSTVRASSTSLRRSNHLPCRADTSVPPPRRFLSALTHE